VAAHATAAAGYVMWAASRIAAFTGNIEHALDLADHAYDLGRQLGDRGVEALGLMYRGFYRLCLGNTRDGLMDQNHAGALALSCKLDPLTSAALYCNILWACRSLGDWARANQWSAGYQQLCADAGMDFSGSCQLHHAEVLAVRGTLNEALDYIRDALARLPGDAPWSLGDAHRVLGDIHSAIGNSKEAFEAYDKSYALGWSPEPGRAMLLAEQGEFDAAYASLERSLEGESWRSVQQQGVLLAHLALVAALAGRRNKAFALIEQISAQSERWPMASISATTSEASGILAREQGDFREALQHFHRARQLWTEIGSRLNATRLHLRIAEAQLTLGDKTGAASEARIALKVATELKSTKLMKQCRQLQVQCLNALPLAS
jgi:tetratricopeptide (TPR) repeat protein